MPIRLLLLGLAAASLAVPAAAQTAIPAQAGLSAIQLAQSANYSVRNTQDLLNRLGYDAGPVDGIMGSRTQAAIMAYQRDHGLSVTGGADADLYADMLDTAASTGTAGGTDATTEETATTSTGSTMIRSGHAVVDVQTALRRRGYDIPMVSGVWDVPTRDAILEYQRDAGLTPTGTIDEALVASLGTAATTETVDRRELVRDIQAALNSRGYDAGPADGTLSPRTQAAIRTYEADAGLPVTGTASPALLARIETGGTAAASETATVMAIQDELIARGYLEGEADGVAGAATSAAIRAFQEDAGLAVTGTPNATLLATLRASDLTRRSVNRQQVVAEIEEELRVKGYAVGPVDGDVDARTEAAIRAFQRDAGLEVDGRASGRLLAAIRASDVTAAPLTPEQAVQGLIQGTTTRLLESIVRPEREPAE